MSSQLEITALRSVPARLPRPSIDTAEPVGPTPGEAPLASSIAGPVKWGYWIVGLFVATFGVWGSIAQLAGGALAPGVVSPEGNRRTVQHLEGGIVYELRVKDGDRIEAGQPLVVIADVQVKSNFEMLASDRRSLLARQVRLEAERHGHDRITFPPELAGFERDVVALVESQTNIFKTRRAHFLARQQVLEQRVAQLEEQIHGYRAQAQGATQQRAMLREELDAKEEMLRKGYIPKPEVLRLKRLDADTGGREGEFNASIARARQQIGETKVELASLNAERADQIAAEADKLAQDLAQNTEKLRASSDILHRTVVKAPVAGTIVNLKIRNIGAVVQRGEPLMEIVPEADKLLIEARVSPLDIDVVHGGLMAQVHFSAYSSRRAPRLFGKIISVSADRMFETGTQKPYYLAKVEVDIEVLKSKAPWIQLIPGMPADVLIVTEERSMISYLIQPFRDAMRRGLRET